MDDPEGRAKIHPGVFVFPNHHRAGVIIGILRVGSSRSSCSYPCALLGLPRLFVGHRECVTKDIWSPSMYNVTELPTGCCVNPPLFLPPNPDWSTVLRYHPPAAQVG